ncbi:MAG TPA: DsrE family protein [Usitatibacter sp.]|jgi:intracellular sulfur oxidation DsrE/DsrF family protein|nr:DsrE family protein [Usitatibacter sp.]
MNARTRLFTLCAPLALVFSLGACAPMAQSTHSASARQQVVIQVSDNDPGKWNLALNNARNMQHDLGASNVDIEIVAYGPGIDMLRKESKVAQRIDEATMSGTKVVACENTMRGHKLSKSDMIEGIGYVPAGVVEITKRQREGWSYLRP